MKHCVHKWWRWYVVIYIVSINKFTAFLYFGVMNVTFSSSLQLFFIFFGTEFEVLTVLMFHNAVWGRTPYSLVHGYECFRGAFWVYLHWLSIVCGVGGRSTDVVPHNSRSYHQKHPLLWPLSQAGCINDDYAACSAVSSSFHTEEVIPYNLS